MAKPNNLSCFHEVLMVLKKNREIIADKIRKNLYESNVNSNLFGLHDKKGTLVELILEYASRYISQPYEKNILGTVDVLHKRIGVTNKDYGYLCTIFIESLLSVLPALEKAQKESVIRDWTLIYFNMVNALLEERKNPKLTQLEFN